MSPIRFIRIELIASAVFIILTSFFGLFWIYKANMPIILDKKTPEINAMTPADLKQFAGAVEIINSKDFTLPKESTTATKVATAAGEINLKNQIPFNTSDLTASSASIPVSPTN